MGTESRPSGSWLDPEKISSRSRSFRGLVKTRFGFYPCHLFSYDSRTLSRSSSVLPPFFPILWLVEKLSLEIVTEFFCNVVNYVVHPFTFCLIYFRNLQTLSSVIQSICSASSFASNLPLASSSLSAQLTFFKMCSLFD